MTDKRAAVLFLDIAGSTSLRTALGDEMAGRRMSKLLADMMAAIDTHGGAVLKSDGDDLLAVFTNGDAVASFAAQSAIDCQHAAKGAGLQLYAGLSTGPIRFVEVLGRQDVEGLAVNMAARLHKLIPNEPGFIFVDGDTLTLLTADLKGHCRPFGTRDLKGIGRVEVFSMDWDEQETGAGTQIVDASQVVAPRDLVLSIGPIKRFYSPESKRVVAGRGESCDFVVRSLLVSGRHVEFAWENGVWTVRDLSRNGTWIRLSGSGSEARMPDQPMGLTMKGWLCLGQTFDMDGPGSTTLEFEQMMR
jgi:class 3 adenylate cyclase